MAKSPLGPTFVVAVPSVMTGCIIHSLEQGMEIRKAIIDELMSQKVSLDREMARVHGE